MAVDIAVQPLEVQKPVDLPAVKGRQVEAHLFFEGLKKQPAAETFSQFSVRAGLAQRRRQSLSLALQVNGINPDLGPVNPIRNRIGHISDLIAQPVEAGGDIADRVCPGCRFSRIRCERGF